VLPVVVTTTVALAEAFIANMATKCTG